MQFHEGMRLKNFIEKSHLEVKEIALKADIPRTTLYGMFEKKELLRSKVEIILAVLKVPVNKFYTLSNDLLEDDGGQDFLNENSQLRQIINLLKKQIEQNEEVIALLKKRK